MAIRLHTALMDASGQSRIALSPPPVSGDILTGTAIIYDENHIADWHDGIKIEWDSGTAYAVLDDPAFGTIAISYLTTG